MKTVYIHAGIGGVAAALLGTVLPLGNPGSALLTVFATLPILVVGLAHGLTGASIAGAVSIGVAMVALGLPGLVAQGLLVSGPAVLVGGVLGQAAGLALRRPTGRFDLGSGLGLSVGLLSIWFVGLIILAMILTAGTDGGLRGVVEGAIGDLGRELALMTGSPAFADMARFAHLIPGMGAAGLMMMALINIAPALLLQRTLFKTTTTVGFSGMILPGWVIDGLIVAAMGSFLSGWPGFLAQNALIIFLLAVSIAGISVVHALLRDVPARSAALVVFYLMLVMIPLAPLLVAGLGLAEHWIGVRRRFAPNPTEEE